MDDLTPDQLKRLAVIVHANIGLHNFLFEIMFSTILQFKTDAEFDGFCNTLRDRVRYKMTGVPTSMPDEVSLAIQQESIQSLERFISRLQQARQTTQTSPGQ